MIDSSTTDWSKSDEAWSDDNDNFGKCLPCSQYYYSHFVLLKNLETEFSPCCQLDVKVGTRMYGNSLWLLLFLGDGASPAKIARHKLTCQTTTSGSIGLRICGLKVVSFCLFVMQVFDISSKQWIIRNKTWGKQLTPQTIIPAISIFFFVNNRLQPDLIQCAISQLCDLRRCVRQCTWRFWSSSILFTRSAYAGSQLALHVIDFGNCNFSGNYNSPDDVGFDMCCNVGFFVRNQ